MATISSVCDNLFSQTNLAQLPRKPVRSARRNLARIVYRQGRRPGLVNPQPASDEASRPAKRAAVTGSPQRPMRHVYKFHEPPRAKPGSFKAKLRAQMVPRLSRGGGVRKAR
jgi:hypothetical protein